MKCKECLIDKDLSEFYKHSQMKSGYLSQCKSCKKSYQNKYRKENIEYVRQYDRNRPNKEQRYINDYVRRKSIKYKEAKNKNAKKYNEKNKLKKSAHSKVQCAIETGKLIKEKCKVCGNEKTHGHHEDYSKPLEVIWLCHKHHMEIHKKKREMERRNDQQSNTDR